MAVIANLPVRPARPARTLPNSTPVQEREQATIWLNVGVKDANGKFFNLPLGLPIDTMKFIELKGQNQEWIDDQDARNAVLEALQLKGAELEPGQAVDVPGLTIQLRRVNSAVTPTAAPNRASLVADLVAMFSAKPSEEESSSE